MNYAKTLTPSQLAEAKELVEKYHDVLDDSYLDEQVVGVECDIDTGDHAPLSCQPFQVSPAKRTKIEAKIDKMLQLGVIEPSTSPWASPFFLVSQPGKEDREVVDYRPLNGVTKKEIYPLPRIDDTLSLPTASSSALRGTVPAVTGKSATRCALRSTRPSCATAASFSSPCCRSV